MKDRTHHNWDSHDCGCEKCTRKRRTVWPWRRVRKVALREAERRNQKVPCRCQHCAADVPEIQTKKFGLVRFKGTLHEAEHLTSCRHSELRETAVARSVIAQARTRARIGGHLRPVPTVIIR